MVLQRGLVKGARSHEYRLIPLPLGRGRNVGLATPSVLPLSPSFTIWKQITEIFWELQGMTRNKNPAASLFTTLTFFFFSISTEYLTSLGLFLQWTPPPLLSDLYELGSVLSSCSINMQIRSLSQKLAEYYHFLHHNWRRQSDPQLAAWPRLPALKATYFPHSADSCRHTANQ